MKKINMGKIKKINKKKIHYWIHYHHYIDDDNGRKNNEPTESGIYFWIFPRKVSDKFIRSYCERTHSIYGIPTENIAGDYFSYPLEINRKGSRAIATIVWGYDI